MVMGLKVPSFVCSPLQIMIRTHNNKAKVILIIVRGFKFCRALDLDFKSLACLILITAFNNGILAIM
jgi:hypothetical protein